MALSDLGSFTAAASQLRIAQSSLSRAVKQAERSLQLQLFERTTRRVTPTEAGVTVVGVARQIMADYNSGMSHLDGYLDGTWGSLRLSCLPSLAATLLPPFLRRFGQQFPDVSVTVDDALSEGAIDSLINGASDLALVASRGALPAHLRRRLLAEDVFYAVFAPEHPSADAPSVPWESLSGERYIAFSHATSIRSRVDAAMDEHAVTVEQVLEARNVTTVGGLVAGGVGVSVVPAFVLPMLRFAGVRPVELTPTVTRPIMILRDGRRPATKPVLSWLDLMWSDESLRLDLPGVRWEPRTL